MDKLSREKYKFNLDLGLIQREKKDKNRQDKNANNGKLEKIITVKPNLLIIKIKYKNFNNLFYIYFRLIRKKNQ